MPSSLLLYSQADLLLGDESVLWHIHALCKATIHWWTAAFMLKQMCLADSMLTSACSLG